MDGLVGKVAGRPREGFHVLRGSDIVVVDRGPIETRVMMGTILHRCAGLARDARGQRVQRHDRAAQGEVGCHGCHEGHLDRGLGIRVRRAQVGDLEGRHDGVARLQRVGQVQRGGLELRQRLRDEPDRDGALTLLESSTPAPIESGLPPAGCNRHPWSGSRTDAREGSARH